MYSQDLTDGRQYFIDQEFDHTSKRPVKENKYAVHLQTWFICI